MARKRPEVWAERQGSRLRDPTLKPKYLLQSQGITRYYSGPVYNIANCLNSGTSCVCLSLNTCLGRRSAIKAIDILLSKEVIIGIYVTDNIYYLLGSYAVLAYGLPSLYLPVKKVIGR